MSLLDHARRMATYNRWMNEGLYALCATLSEAERRRDMGAFFRSVHGTLNHILLADRLWMGRFLGEPFAADSLDQELHADFATLRAEREREDARIIAWVESLSPETLEGELGYTRMVNPEPRRIPYALSVSQFLQPPDPPPRPAHHAADATGARSGCHGSHLVAGSRNGCKPLRRDSGRSTRRQKPAARAGHPPAPKARSVALAADLLALEARSACCAWAMPPS